MSEDDLVIKPQPLSRWYDHITWQTCVSIISFVISLFSVWFSWQQVEIGRRQAVAAEGERDASAISAKAAERSALAAEEALRSTKEEGRARLSNVLLNPSALIPGQRFGVDLFLKNNGRGTATNIAQKIWVQLLKSSTNQLPHPSTEQITAESLGFEDFIVSAASFPRPLTQQEVDDLKAGAKTLFFYGEVEFRDESRAERKLRWCAYYTGERPTAAGLLPSCKFHNSSN